MTPAAYPRQVSRGKLLLLTAGVAFLLRMGFVLAWQADPLPPDSASYLSLARQLASGHGFSMDGASPDASRAPLYPMSLAGLDFIFGERIRIIQIAQALIDSLSAVWVFLLACSVAGEAAGFASGLAYALHPVFAGFTCNIVSETLFFQFLFLSLMLWGSAARKDRSGLFAASGAALGLAVLCRPAHLFYLGALLPAWLVSRRRQALKEWALALGVFVLCLVPWTIRNHVRFGRFIPVMTGGGAAWWIGSLTHYPSSEESDRLSQGRPKDPAMEGIFMKTAKENWRRDAGPLLRQMPKRLFKFWVTSHSSVFRIEQSNETYRTQRRWGTLAFKASLMALQTMTLLFGLWGALALRARWRQWLWLALPAAYVSLHVFNDWGPSRYHLSALPCFWIIGAWALAERVE